MPRTIHLVSLGCPKNRVDSEVMLGVAQRLGYEHTATAGDAELIVVNTCGFIEPAKQESIDTILDLARHKETGACRKLIVAGCLSQRYAEELGREIPEVDHFLGSSDMPRLADALESGAERMLVGSPAQWVIGSGDPRVVSTRGASAYVKLAEGCNRSCAFCVIPRLRGRQRSREPDDIVEEARWLVDAGVLELNLVSQDTIAYGRDLAGVSLAPLVRRLADVPGVRWVRLFYLYPERPGPEIVDLLANHPHVLPYVDMPLQHAADDVLARMRRGRGGRRLRDLVDHLRSAVPNLVFRTTFLVGHPGETDRNFRELVDFVRWARFDRVGVFRYSDEEGSRSAAMSEKVEPAVAATRAAELMALQRSISREKNEALVGRRLLVLVEGPSEESDLVMAGRHAGQAPDIDGCVFVGGGVVHPGAMYWTKVTQASDYDLAADVLEPDPTPVAGSGAGPASRAPLVHRASDGRRVSLQTVR